MDKHSDKISILDKVLAYNDKELLKVLNQFKLGNITVTGYINQCDFINVSTLNAIRRMVSGE